MTQETFSEILAVLEEAFGIEFSASRQQVWWTLLGELDDQDAMRATVLCCRESKYPPKPADIWTRCRPAASGDERTAMAIQAWADAREAIADPYRSVQFADRVIPLVLEALGGVMVLSQKTDEELATFVRREFERLYLALQTAGRHHPTGYLTGIFERDNRMRSIEHHVDVVQVGSQRDTARIEGPQ